MPYFKLLPIQKTASLILKTKLKFKEKMLKYENNSNYTISTFFLHNLICNAKKVNNYIDLIIRDNFKPDRCIYLN